MLKNLGNKKIAVLVTDGFEKIELTLPMKALQSQGADVDVISLHHGKIRSMNLHKPAGTFKVDRIVSEVSPDEYDALFIPGGFINPDLLRQSHEVRQFVKAFHELGRPIASICHGPWVLVSAGILGGKTLTSWPGLRDDLVNAGVTWIDHQAVTDGNLLASRGPQDLPFFIPALIAHFEKPRGGRNTSELSHHEHVSSAPQPTEPPAMAAQAVRYIPNFPFKWAAIAGTVGLGIYGVLTNKGTTLPCART